MRKFCYRYIKNYVIEKDENMNCIDNYLNNILVCQLKRFGVSDSICNQIL